MIVTFAEKINLCRLRHLVSVGINLCGTADSGYWFRWGNRWYEVGYSNNWRTIVINAKTVARDGLLYGDCIITDGDHMGRIEDN